MFYVQGNNTKVDNATCGNSSATKYGGAFYIYGVNATISNSSVENTNATLSGGAIYIDGINADIEDSSFEKTNAFGSTTNDGGGAIFIKGDLASVDRSNFTEPIPNLKTPNLTYMVVPFTFMVLIPLYVIPISQIPAWLVQNPKVELFM